MRPENIDIVLQTIETVKAIGGGVFLKTSMVVDGLEADGFELNEDDEKAIKEHCEKVISSANHIMWRELG